MLKIVSSDTFKWKKLPLKITWRKSFDFSFCGACPPNITMKPKNFSSFQTAKVPMPFLPNGKMVILMSQAQEELFFHVLQRCVLTRTFFSSTFSSVWKMDYGNSVYRKSCIPGFRTEPLLGTIQPLKRFLPRLQSLKNKGRVKREKENSFDVSFSHPCNRIWSTTSCQILGTSISLFSLCNYFDFNTLINPIS